MQFKISIRKANFKDTRFLLKIHNESVKRKFINSTKINNKNIYIWDRWFKNKLKSKNFITFIGNKNQKKFGYVSFDEIKKNIFEVRIGNLPNFYNKGLGSLMLSISLKKFFKKYKPKKIISVVKKFNKRSSKCFLKNGFKKKKINYQNYFFLSKFDLKNDEYFELNKLTK